MNNIEEKEEITPKERTEALNAQLEKTLGEIRQAYDMAKDMDDRDELLFSLYDLEDVQSSLETICNTSEEIE